jgi:TM2 domain-containing membrane protein YozV
MSSNPKVEINKINPDPSISTKSPTAVLLLCIFLGGMGIHRFYVGKIGTGILMLLTFGGLGIWALIDLALILSNKFTDSKDNIIELMKNPPEFKITIGVIFVLMIILFVFYSFLIGSDSDTKIEIKDDGSPIKIGNIQQKTQSENPSH